MKRILFDMHKVLTNTDCVHKILKLITGEELKGWKLEIMLYCNLLKVLIDWKIGNYLPHRHK